MTSQTATDKMGRTKLMLTIKSKSNESVKEAFHYSQIQGGNLFLTDANGRTALFYSAERGDEEIVLLLLASLAGTGIACQRGALLNIRENEGNLAENWAQLHGQETVQKILAIERGRIEFFE